MSNKHKDFTTDKMPLPERFEMWKRDAGEHLKGAERALFERDMQDAAVVQTMGES